MAKQYKPSKAERERLRELTQKAQQRGKDLGQGMIGAFWMGVIFLLLGIICSYLGLL